MIESIMNAEIDTLYAVIEFAYKRDSRYFQKNIWTSFNANYRYPNDYNRPQIATEKMVCKKLHSFLYL